MDHKSPNGKMEGKTSVTRVVSVDVSRIGKFHFADEEYPYLGEWELEAGSHSSDYVSLQEAASLLRNTDVPVAFPTETVYGLGADATRSAAVQGIYKAKQRPADNPLIVHISSISQLKELFLQHQITNPIPPIYHPLLQKFWPGPLTILIPLPDPSPFAKEVTAGQSTVGIRMPSSHLALALIKMAGTPLAAPSANASTRPSPTTAAHVLHDLDGRIDLIVDGGPCRVGVESTVVDGLHDPPLILRPGGVSIEMLRQCPGWESVRIGYHDKAQNGIPRAPGMKYKHYSPRARVLLYRGVVDPANLRSYHHDGRSFGLIRTSDKAAYSSTVDDVVHEQEYSNSNGLRDLGAVTRRSEIAPAAAGDDNIMIWTISLGPDISHVAQGLFSALRDLDSRDVSVIFVEAVDEEKGDAAAAVMNRLRKAAEREIGFIDQV